MAGTLFMLSHSLGGLPCKGGLISEAEQNLKSEADGAHWLIVPFPADW